MTKAKRCVQYALAGCVGAAGALIAASPAQAWTFTATSGGEEMFLYATLPATSGTSKLRVCDVNTGASYDVPGPVPGTLADNPMSEDGLVEMLGGNDGFWVAQQDGLSTRCGTVYAVSNPTFTLEIAGGDGDDLLFAGPGECFVYGDEASAVCVAGTGHAGDDTLLGGYDNHLYGCAGDDRLLGGHNTSFTPFVFERIEGGAGADCLEHRSYQSSFSGTGEFFCGGDVGDHWVSPPSPGFVAFLPLPDHCPMTPVTTSCAPFGWPTVRWF